MRTVWSLLPALVLALEVDVLSSNLSQTEARSEADTSIMGRILDTWKSLRAALLTLLYTVNSLLTINSQKAFILYTFLLAHKVVKKYTFERFLFHG